MTEKKKRKRWAGPPDENPANRHLVIPYPLYQKVVKFCHDTQREPFHYMRTAIEQAVTDKGR